MQINDDGIALIKEFEGFRAKAYRDAVGVWTIGYGHTSAAGAPVVSAGVVIAQAEAEVILRRDIEKFSNGVAALLMVQTNDNQFSAMVSLAFNVGLGNFGKSSLLRFHNAADPAQAATRFALWNKAGGKVLPGLVRRREAERRLYTTPDDPKPVLAPAHDAVAIPPNNPRRDGFTASERGKRMDIISGYKTYFTAIAGIIAALAAYANGTTDIPATIAAVWVALQTINLRDAVSKIGK